MVERSPGTQAISPEAGAEIRTLLEGMSPEIANLLLRMMEVNGLTPEQARAFRDDIVALNHKAQTELEQVALLAAFNGLMDRVERELVAAEALEQFKGVRKGDYRLMLSVQAMDGELIDPTKLDYITRREVGRLAADDDFRQFAVDGAAVLGKPSKAPKSRNWLATLLGRK